MAVLPANDLTMHGFIVIVDYDTIARRGESMIRQTPFRYCRMLGLMAVTAVL
jgi:hypothetical protein